MNSLWNTSRGGNRIRRTPPLAVPGMPPLGGDRSRLNFFRRGSAEHTPLAFVGASPAVGASLYFDSWGLQLAVFPAAEALPELVLTRVQLAGGSPAAGALPESVLGRGQLAAFPSDGACDIAEDVADDACGVAESACGVADDACGIAEGACRVEDEACRVACGVADDD